MPWSDAVAKIEPIELSAIKEIDVYWHLITQTYSILFALCQAKITLPASLSGIPTQYLISSNDTACKPF